MEATRREVHPARPAALRARNLWAPALAALALVALPAAVGPFYEHVATDIFVSSLYALSVNLLLGYGGMVSFGQAAYFGVGAYAGALLITRAGWPAWAAFVVAPAVAAAVALVVGFFSIRLSGVYFAMLTLAFAQLLYSVVFQWYGFTGGDNGIVGVFAPAPLDSTVAYYWFTLVVVVAASWILWRITESPFGLVLQMVRERPHRALAIGVNVKRHQLITFVLAGAFAGLAGVLYLFEQRSAFPDYLGVSRSLEPLLMVLVGGMRHFLGPVVGAAVIRILHVTVTRYVEMWQFVVGLVLILIVVLYPGGIMEAWQRWRARRRHDGAHGSA